MTIDKSVCKGPARKGGHVFGCIASTRCDYQIWIRVGASPKSNNNNNNNNKILLCKKEKHKGTVGGYPYQGHDAT